MNKLYMDKEWLKEQYISLKKSTRNIANLCQCNKCTVNKWLRKFSIPIRKRNEINSGKFKKGCIPWHKGKKGVYSEERIEQMKKAKLGKKLSLKTIEKMKKSAHRGKDHHGWKEKPCITNIHEWVKRYKPKLINCEICGKKKKLELSNISGEYKRDISDYQWLCHKCHVNHDIKNGLWGNSQKKYKKERRRLMLPS